MILHSFPSLWAGFKAALNVPGDLLDSLENKRRSLTG